MNRFLGIALVSVCAGVGCNALNSLTGRCNVDQDCGTGAICDHSTGTGVCVSQLCRPACNSSQTCDPQTVTCKDVASASVAVTSPGANSFAGFSLQAAASARAPGGVGGLIFQVRNATTAEVLVSVPGTPSSVGAADFSATIPLNGANINEGPALLLVATISYQTSKTLDSDPVPIKIDHTPPVLDTSGYDGTVSPWVGPGNPNAIVAVHVTDSGAGVDPAGVKLTLLPPGDGSSYTGAPGTGGTYTFTVPLAAMGVADTTVNPAVPFKVDAKDAVGNGAAPQTGATLVIRVDRKTPDVAITPDTTWYAGTAGPVTVTATISDADSGLVTTGAAKPFLKIGGGTPVPGTFVSGSWNFSFNPAAQAPNTEGPLSFTITAQDVAGNVLVKGDSRKVDNKGPQIQPGSLQVFLETATPTAAGVNYPAFTPPPGYATGRDGAHFIYSDSIHIKGTITDDGAGLDASTTQFRIDGTVFGTPQALSCADGSAACNIDVGPIRLNDLTKTGRIDAGLGNLSLVILAKDKPAIGTANSISANSLSVGISRLLWSRQFSSSTVSGMAVHPNGDLIVTTAITGSADSVFAQFMDGRILSGVPPEDWHAGKNLYAAGVDLGPIEGGPIIGDGSSAAKIYIASHATNGDIVALDPATVPSSNRLIWSCGKDSLGAFHATPAVGSVIKLGTANNCEAVFAGSEDTNLWAACQNSVSPTGCVSRPAAISDPDNVSPASIVNSKIYVGTETRNAEISISTTTGALSVTPFPTAVTGRFTGITIGTMNASTTLFTGTATNNTVYGFTQSDRTQLFSTNVSSPVQGQPIQDGNLLLIDTGDSKLHGLDVTVTPIPDQVLKTLLTAGRTPLLAADGHIYIVRGGAVQAIADTAGYVDVWSYSIAATATAAPTMDCNGMLYAAAADTVYALITDMVGAANTGGLRANVPWPKFQRDSRNTGNADFSTVWGVRTGGGSCTQ